MFISLVSEEGQAAVHRSNVARRKTVIHIKGVHMQGIVHGKEGARLRREEVISGAKQHYMGRCSGVYAKKGRASSLRSAGAVP